MSHTCRKWWKPMGLHERGGTTTPADAPVVAHTPITDWNLNSWSYFRAAVTLPPRTSSDRDASAVPSAQPPVRLSIPLTPVHPPARAPAMPARAGACAGRARSSPRSGAAPLRDGRASRGHSWARTAGRAPCSGGRPGTGDSRHQVLCWAGGAVRVPAGMPQGRAPVGEDDARKPRPAWGDGLSESARVAEPPAHRAAPAGREAKRWHRAVQPVPPRGPAFPAGRQPCRSPATTSRASLNPPGKRRYQLQIRSWETVNVRETTSCIRAPSERFPRSPARGSRAASQ